MKTVFVLIDACKSEYIQEDRMPFLYHLCQSGRYIKSIFPSPGFCERSEIFTGLDCYDSGNFTAIGWTAKDSEYYRNAGKLYFYEALSHIYDRGARALFRRSWGSNKPELKSYFIPFRSLSHFMLTEDGDKRYIEYEEIFDVLNRNNLSYTLDCFTSLANVSNLAESSIVDEANKYMSRNIYFIPVYIGTLDYKGHIFGNDYDQMMPYFRGVDSMVESIYNNSKNNGYAFAVLGDHGMVPVRRKADVNGCVCSRGLRLHKDYEAFYDSTYARFWPVTEKAGQIIKKALAETLAADGRVLFGEDGTKKRIPMDIKTPDGRCVYGDILWCANPGVLIKPDYFNKPGDIIKGMHGYLETDKRHGGGMFTRTVNAEAENGIVESAHLSDVCEELCSLLEIETPNSKGWKRKIN